MSNVQPNTAENADDTTPLPLRNDTMLGVCAAIGEQFGFNPNFLRVAIGSLVIFDIMLAFAVYLGLALAVGLGYLIFPRRRQAVAAQDAGQLTEEANDSAAAPESLAA